MTNTGKEAQNIIDQMFSVGAHFGYSRSRRHPTMKPFIFGVKNRVEIFDLEKTKDMLDKAKQFVRELAATGKSVLFVGGKSEARDAVKQGALALDMPYVAGRWIGGTLTNFPVIRSRVEKLLTLRVQKEKGELTKYTKKERLLIDREIERLERFFEGIVGLPHHPGALFVVDPRKEHIAVAEARKNKIPVVGLLNSDCDLSQVDYAIIGNDASIASVKFFVSEVVESYKDGRLNGSQQKEKKS
jgi:small subunit ribosomal protein S2